jgi:hypothetical protein
VKAHVALTNDPSYGASDLTGAMLLGLATVLDYVVGTNSTAMEFAEEAPPIDIPAGEDRRDIQRHTPPIVGLRTAAGLGNSTVRSSRVHGQRSVVESTVPL